MHIQRRGVLYYSNVFCFVKCNVIARVGFAFSTNTQIENGPIEESEGEKQRMKKPRDGERRERTRERNREDDGSEDKYMSI